MKIYFLIALVMMVPGLAFSESYTRYKSTACGDFMRDTKNQVNVALVSEYIRGFLSGYNLSSKRKQVNQELSNNTLGLWVEKHCIANPLSNVESAAPVLLVELTGPLKQGK